MSWVVELNGYDLTLPGLSSVVIAMGPGIAFPDHSYAPSGFFSWQSANQKVDCAQAGGVQLTTDTGQLILQNLPDDVTQPGPFDYLANWAFYLRRANLFWIGDGTWANRQLVDTAVMEQPFATLLANGSINSTWVIQLRDPRAILDVPLQTVFYGGTNANGLGVDGEADLKGAAKPILYGVVSNIEPIRVNAALLIYQVCDRPGAVLCVRDGGLALSCGTVRASLTTLQSTSPTPGTYDVYTGPEGVFFRLGTTPVFQITCDAQEGVGRANLLQQCRAAEQAAWVKTNCTPTANSSAAPDGTTTADTVTRTSASASYTGQSVTLTAIGATYTYWGEFHPSIGNFVAMAANSGTGRADACFNLSTGAVSMAAAVSGDFPSAQAGIIPKAGGYYRCWLIFTTDGESSVECFYSPSTVSQAVDGAGSASSAAVIVADQMLSQGFNPYLDIVPTTTAPVTATRQNLFSDPCDFTNAVWTKTGCTATGDTTRAPDASQTADTIARTTIGNSNVNQTVTKAAAKLPYTVSVYADPLAGNFVALCLDDGAGNRADVCFDLSAGAVSLAPAVTGTFANATADVLHQADGSWRLWLTATTNTATSVRGAYSTSSVSQKVDGTGSANSTSMALWGALLEQASQVSQYLAASGLDMSQRTHAQLWARMRTERCGTPVSLINMAQLAIADAADSNEVGFYFTDASGTQLDAMNALLTSFSGYEVEGFDFTWFFGKVVAPSGPTVLDFCIVTAASALTPKNRGIRTMQQVRPGFAPDGAPPYLINLNWGLNNTEMAEADFAGAAPQRLRDKFGIDYRTEIRTNPALWNPAANTGPWPNAPQLTIDTAYQPGDDGLTAPHAGAESQRLLDLYSANKDAYQLSFTPEVTDQMVVGQVCSLTYPQFGLSSGPIFMVIQTFLKVVNELPEMTLVLGFQT